MRVGSTSGVGARLRLTSCLQSVVEWTLRRSHGTRSSRCRAFRPHVCSCIPTWLGESHLIKRMWKKENNRSTSRGRVREQSIDPRSFEQTSAAHGWFWYVENGNKMMCRPHRWRITAVSPAFDCNRVSVHVGTSGVCEFRYPDGSIFCY